MDYMLGVRERVELRMTLRFWELEKLELPFYELGSNREETVLGGRMSRAQFRTE